MFLEQQWSRRDAVHHEGTQHHRHDHIRRMPRLSMGMKLACDAALLQASGAATPSMIPVPKSSGCLETLFLPRRR